MWENTVCNDLREEHAAVASYLYIRCVESYRSCLVIWKWPFKAYSVFSHLAVRASVMRRPSPCVSLFLNRHHERLPETPASVVIYGGLRVLLLHNWLRIWHPHWIRILILSLQDEKSIFLDFVLSSLNHMNDSMVSCFRVSSGHLPRLRCSHKLTDHY